MLKLFKAEWILMAVNVFIVHQLKKKVLKVIPTLSFLCAVIVVVWILLFFYI